MEKFRGMYAGCGIAKIQNLQIDKFKERREGIIGIEVISTSIPLMLQNSSCSSSCPEHYGFVQKPRKNFKQKNLKVLIAKTTMYGKKKTGNDIHICNIKIVFTIVLLIFPHQALNLVSCFRLS